MVITGNLTISWIEKYYDNRFELIFADTATSFCEMAFTEVPLLSKLMINVVFAIK